MEIAQTPAVRFVIQLVIQLVVQQIEPAVKFEQQLYSLNFIPPHYRGIFRGIFLTQTCSMYRPYVCALSVEELRRHCDVEEISIILVESIADVDTCQH